MSPATDTRLPPPPALAQVLQIGLEVLRAAARKPLVPQEPISGNNAETAAPADNSDVLTTYAARELITRDLWNDTIRAARHTLWLHGMSEYRYAFDIEVPAILREVASTGCQIKVLLLHPAFSGIVDIDRDAGNPEGPLATSITVSLTRFDAMRQDCGAAMKLRIYASPPTMSIVRADDHLIVTPYVRYLAGRSSPTLEERRASDEGTFDRYTRHFDSAWNRARDWIQ